MTVLAETYFRLRIRVQLSDQRNLQDYLQSKCSLYAQGLFSQQPQFEVTLEQGTLRGWIIAAGLISNAIIFYGGLRTGIDYLTDDARHFSQRALSEIERSGISDDEVLRAERRLGVPGKISRLIRRIDYVKHHGRDLSKAEYDSQMKAIESGMDNILSAIDDRHDRDFIRAQIPEEIGFPPPQPIKLLHDSGREALRPTAPRLIEYGTSSDHKQKVLGRRRPDVPFQVRIGASGLKLVREK